MSLKNPLSPRTARTFQRSRPAASESRAATERPVVSALDSARDAESFVSRRYRWFELGLLAVTGLLYFWNLTNSGYGNSFYSAAIRAGSENWVSLLFGSLDANNGITVDKPPASLWIPALFGQMFGFSSWTVLAPQALMGVGAVWCLTRAVRRTNGPVAGLLAGFALAFTPVATMMFRFNNPDALLTLLLTLAAYAMIRAVQAGSKKWLYTVGLILGLAFLTKMLQGFLTIPALALAYLWAAPLGLRRRITDMWAAILGLVTLPAVYLTIFQLTPTSIRPYMAGSENNSFWELTLGYNGLGRIFGGSGNGGGGGAGGMGGSANTGFGGSTGLGRMFNAAFGGEISWLLPGALLLLIAGLWFTRRAPRTDSTRSALVIWGGWLLITAMVFSFMEGTIHPYYAVAMAPAIAAIIGIGSWELYRGRDVRIVRIVFSLFLLVNATWAFVLLARQGDWLPWLKYAILVCGMLASAGFALDLDRLRTPARRKVSTALLVLALLGSFGGTAAYSVATASVGHTGSIPTSGPVSSAMGGGMGGQAQPSGQSQGGQASGTDLATALKSTTTAYSAATVGATSAADMMLSSDTEVLDIGGWMGSDPYPSLAEFQEMVKNGDITYFIAGQSGGGTPGGTSGETTTSQAITAWVQANYEATTLGGQTVYKLT